MATNESMMQTGEGSQVAKSAEEEALERLNVRQQKFLFTYLSNGFIGWKAAHTAGYSGDEYALAATASKLIRNPNIRTVLNARLMEAAMPAHRVLHKISMIADADITEYMDDEGNINIRELKKAGKGFLLKRLKRKQSKKVVTREAFGENGTTPKHGEVESEVVETSVVHEEVDIESYSSHEALRDLLRVHNLAGGVQVGITLTLDQVKSMTDEDLDTTIAKLEQAARGR